MTVLQVLLLAGVASVRSQLNVPFSPDGSYSVRFNKETTAISGSLSLRANGQWYHASQETDPSLTLQGISQSQGSDVFGAYTKETASWAVNETVLLKTAITTYQSVTDLVIFEQTFPSGLKETSYKEEYPIAGFPSFNTTKPGMAQSPWFTWYGIGAGHGHALYQESTPTAAPLAFVLNSTVLVLAPLDNLKHACIKYGPNDTSSKHGISTSIPSLPAGFVHRTMLVANTTVTRGMAE
eukprot:m.257203 g.257203  ORF g.257203 m.257203 type:complete len:238 (-) comp17581_c0_seq4:112-825(-)